MKYDKFKYIYCPRPEYKIPDTDLHKFDTGQYICQPKYNGAACLIFTNGTELHVYNRHKQPLSAWNKEIDFLKLAKSKNWYVYAGEYLNKSQIGETGIKEKDKFVIWDVLVWNGEYLVGQTLMQRLTLLENIYPCNRAVVKGSTIEIYDHLCCTEFNGIYKAPTYTTGFYELYQEVIKTQLYEGLILKKIESKLGYGFNEANNSDWQIKVRRETKLYQF